MEGISYELSIIIQFKYFLLLWHIIFYFLRFPVAIKYGQSNEIGKANLFLDEAKTMLQIGTYHDFIVNLQGIIYSIDETNEDLSEVS